MTLVAFLMAPNIAEGSIYISDMRNLPVAPMTRCIDCDVYSLNDQEVLKALLKSASVLFVLCARSGSNQWDHPATLANCGRGQFHIMNESGEFATYLYNKFDPKNPFGIKAGLLYYGTHNPFEVDIDH